MNACVNRPESQPGDSALPKSAQRALASKPFSIAALNPKAFTLIEVVGVLAVLAILATLMVPAVIKQIDHAAWVKENNDLSSISNALVLSAMRTHTLPDATDWGQAAANWLNLPATQIANTPRNYRRSLLIDPGLATSGLNLSTYSQKVNMGLANPPTNSRLILVSSISSDVPMASGVVSNPLDFQAIWDTPRGALPQTSSVKWSGSGEDLCIQRINLEPLFFQLLLVNRWGGTITPEFSIDANVPDAIQPSGQGTNYYYLDSTVVNLWTNSGGTPGLVTRFLLKRNTSYVFENGMWQGEIRSTPPAADPATLFALQAQIFINAQANLNGASPLDVLSKMFTYMADVSLTNTVSLSVDTTNLFSDAGTNGLLYNPRGGN